jgi:hypothetical protein
MWWQSPFCPFRSRPSFAGGATLLLRRRQTARPRRRRCRSLAESKRVSLRQRPLPARPGSGQRGGAGGFRAFALGRGRQAGSTARGIVYPIAFRGGKPISSTRPTSAVYEQVVDLKAPTGVAPPWCPTNHRRRSRSLAKGGLEVLLAHAPIKATHAPAQEAS